MSVPMFISRRAADRAGLPAGEVALRRAIVIFHVTRRDLMSHRRAPHIIRARDWLAAELRALGWTMTRIGDFLNRNHSTIVVALQRESARRAAGATA